MKLLDINIDWNEMAKTQKRYTLIFFSLINLSPIHTCGGDYISLSFIFKFDFLKFNFYDRKNVLLHTYTHTHTYIYIFISFRSDNPDFFEIISQSIFIGLGRSSKRCLVSAQSWWIYTFAGRPPLCRVWQSSWKRRLWIRSCFSRNVQHFLFVLLGSFVGWVASGHADAVL